MVRFLGFLGTRSVKSCTSHDQAKQHFLSYKKKKKKKPKKGEVPLPKKSRTFALECYCI